MERDMQATFDSVVLAAQFCAELIRQGVTFTVRHRDDITTVTFTGGF